MLQYMRENTGSWIIKIILGVIVIVFVFLGIGSFGSKKRGSVAMVEGEPISMEEYQQSYNNMIQQLRNRFGENLNQELIEMFDVEKQALNILIERRLIALEADRLGVVITEEELRSSLMNIPVFKTNGAFDMDKYKRVLAANRMTPESFEASQIEELKQQKVKDLVLSSVTVSDMEAEKWYKYNNTQVSILYLKFDPDDYVSGITPEENDIVKFYEENKENYKTDVTLNVEYLKFSPEDYAGKGEFTETELKTYYDKNIAEFTSPEKVEASHILIETGPEESDEMVENARGKAMEVYEKALKGEDFAVLAKKYSQGPSADAGGYLGFFTKEEMVQPFSEKAFSMKEGEISTPVKTQFGWHIIKVLTKFESSVQSFEDAKGAIKLKLGEKKGKDLAYYGAGDALDAIIDGDSLEQAGLSTGVSVKKLGPFTRDGDGLDFAGADKFASAAFETPIGEISDVKKVRDDYYIIKPVEKIEPEIKPLSDVREQVKRDLISNKSIEKAEDQAGKILSQATDKTALRKIAQDSNAEIHITKQFAREDSIPEIGEAPSVVNAAFQLTEEKNVYPEVLTAKGIYYIIALNKKEIPKGFPDSDEKKKTKSLLKERKNQEIYSEWIDRLRQEKSVEITAGIFG